jgi:quinoprotein glucose dehydrogenase
MQNNSRIIAAVAGIALMGASSWGQARPKDGEWPTYGADLAATRYRPFDQINASNFNKLEVAWRFKTDSLGNRPEYKLEGTPLMVNGVLYATAGTRRAAVALDAATGELLWVHGEREGARGANAPRQLSGRGLAYWSDGKEERILYVTPGYRLIALDAKTGARIASFGDHGAVDLKVGAIYGTGTQIDLETGEIGWQSAPIVANDTVLVGCAFREGATAKTMNNTKGLVRGFDVRTGKRLWTFRTIPGKGEFGYDTWFDGSADHSGNAGVWTQMTADEQLGLAYLPVESPTADYYAGFRPGPDLFGESLVCVDLKTGQRKWHFQLVHHPIWDMDISSPPILADINVDGRMIKAVAQPTKQGFLYVFDRVTGKPVWPIEERPVEKGNAPGEWYSPTQPFPTKPPAYSRNGVNPDLLINFTPEMHDQALTIAAKYKMGPIFTPAAMSDVNGALATLTLGTGGGGTNWWGGSYDPETHMVYVSANESALSPLGLVPAPAGMSDIKYVRGTAGQPVRFVIGPGEGEGADTPKANAPPPPGGGGNALNVQGLPLVRPPYGSISAISLERGEIVWKIAHGDTPDAIRNHPALKGLNIPRTGQPSGVVTAVTKTLLLAGDPQVTTTPDHPRGAILHAYDKATGNEVGRVWMPAQQSGGVMTYMLNGKQYIVVAVSGGNYSGEYIAFTLPSS